MVPRQEPKTDAYNDLNSRTNDQLMAIMRHEAHRIEKSIYNNIFESKHQDYVGKRDRIMECFSILESRGCDVSQEPTIVWVQEIIDSFDKLPDFIDRNSTPAADYDPQKAQEIVDLVRTRRSVRVWNEEQPPETELREIAKSMIDAARWAPSSGNRQPWRFRIITDPAEKDLLRGVKEEHCISSPLLIFVGMASDVYGALGNEECSLYIDAGAATMQMVLAAHRAGLGVCWNHFATDLIESRPKNMVIYERFAKEMKIPPEVLPVAIIAIGRPAFVPPVPARRDVEDLLL